MGKSTREETNSKERRTRTPLGVMRKKLSLDEKTMNMFKTKGLVPRLINDEDNGMRLREAISGGYDFVSSDGEMIMGDTTAKEELKRRVRKTVGTHKDGSPKYAYLMAIPREYYEADQEVKERQNKMVDDAIQGGKPTGLADHGVDPEKGGHYIKNINYTP